MQLLLAIASVVPAADTAIYVWHAPQDEQPARVELAVLSPLEGPAWVGTPAWSPDGSRLAFDALHPDEGCVSYVWNPTDDSIRTLADGPRASWSPDGTEVSYTTGSGIHVVSADAGGPVGTNHFPTGRLIGPGYYATWSDDGKYFFVHNRWESPPGSVSFLSVSGETTPIALGDVRSRPALAPGRHIVTIIPVDGEPHLVDLDMSVDNRASLTAVLSPVPDGFTRLLDPTVTADGTVFFAANGPGGAAVFRVPPRDEKSDTTPEPELILQSWPGITLSNLGISRDGTKLAFASNLFFAESDDGILHDETELIPE